MIKYFSILSDQLSNQSTADQLRVGANRPEAKVRTHKLMMTLRILNRICTCLMFFGGAVSFDQAVSSPTQLFSSILFWCTSLAEIVFRCTLWVHSTKDKNRIESRTDIIFPIWCENCLAHPSTNYPYILNRYLVVGGCSGCILNWSHWRKASP